MTTTAKVEVGGYARVVREPAYAENVRKGDVFRVDAIYPAIEPEEEGYDASAYMGITASGWHDRGTVDVAIDALEPALDIVTCPSLEEMVAAVQGAIMGIGYEGDIDLVHSGSRDGNNGSAFYARTQDGFEFYFEVRIQNLGQCS